MSNPSADREVPDREDQPVAAVTAHRRTILRAAGLVVLGGSAAVGLAACAGGSAAPQATTAPSSAAPSSAAPSSASPSSASPSSAAPSSSAPATSSAPAPTGPSVATADVPVGSGVILKEPNNYVVTQPTKGTYKAFTSICTHQGCPVAEIQGKNIVCNCHGSEFSIEDGSVVKDPATEPLKEFAATVSGNKVYIDA